MAPSFPKVLWNAVFSSLISNTIIYCIITPLYSYRKSMPPSIFALALLAGLFSTWLLVIVLTYVWWGENNEHGHGTLIESEVGTQRELIGRDLETKVKELEGQKQDTHLKWEEVDEKEASG